MVPERQLERTEMRPLGKLDSKTPLVVFLALSLAIGVMGYAAFAHLK